MASTLTISSKNYSSWSLRGWLLCRMAGLDFEERPVSSNDPSVRADLVALVAVFSRPLPHARRRLGLGCAGDRRVSQRAQSRGGAAALGSQRARAMPLDLRRDAFGLRQLGVRPAAERQGALSGVHRVAG